MIHHIDFPAWGRVSGVQVIWDSEKGTLTGRDAVRVLEYALSAQKQGFVITDPYPTSYEIRDPLHHIAEMAAVLSSMNLRLSLEFAQAFSTLPRPTTHHNEGLQPDGSYIVH